MVTKVISTGEHETRIRELEKRLAQAEGRIAQLEAYPRGMFLPPPGPITWNPNTAAVPGSWTGMPPQPMKQEP